MLQSTSQMFIYLQIVAFLGLPELGGNEITADTENSICHHLALDFASQIDSSIISCQTTVILCGIYCWVMDCWQVQISQKPFTV